MKIFITILVLLAVGSGIYVVATAPREDMQAIVTPEDDISDIIRDETASSTVTSAEVSTHNSDVSCWSIVDGKVYDLTNWISKHPGGKSAIKGMCGVDSTKEFERQHGGEARPEKILASYFYAELQ